jgi:ubiquinone/menaquinone biosynthesis C-methylase UbiE
MRPSTMALLRRAGIAPPMLCLDVGCGGGDVAFDMARAVTPGGSVVATDIDDHKLDLARAEAAEAGIRNLEFRRADALHAPAGHRFDLVHARFLLSHLADPLAALRHMRAALRSGGVLALEDVDFNGYFCHPGHDAFERYRDLYRAVARRKGGDPDIGPRLPGLVAEAGFRDIRMSVAQHASQEGDVKLISALTMENIADAVVHEGLASREEVDGVTDALYEFANTPGTICATPRVFEVIATAR